MDMEYKNGMMDLHIKDNMLKEQNTELENSTGLTEQFTRAIFRKIICKVLAE